MELIADLHRAYLMDAIRAAEMIEGKYSLGRQPVDETLDGRLWIELFECVDYGVSERSPNRFSFGTVGLESGILPTLWSLMKIGM